MSIYINLDTNPDPDCFDELWAIYTLYPPSSEPWSLTWKDEDDDETEQLLCALFNGQRSSEGVVVSNHALPGDFEGICAENDIIINKIGERLEDC